MQYPNRLIPFTNFKLIEADLSGFLLSRIVNTKDQLEKVNGLFPNNTLCEQEKELFDYSTNLLGRFFVEDNKIALIGDDKKYFYTYWDFSEEVRRPVFQKDFEIFDERSFFLLRIDHIHHKISIPCPSPPKNTDDMLVAQVLHTPTRSNFWHFSICWIDQNGQNVKYSGSAWQKRISSTMRHTLQQLIQLQCPDELAPIPEAYYIQNGTMIP